MIQHLTHRRTGEHLTVELEIGPTWWVKDHAGHVRKAMRADFSPAAWHLTGTDLPVEAQGFTTA